MFIIQPPVKGHLSCFHVLSTVNNAANTSSRACSHFFWVCGQRWASGLWGRCWERQPRVCGHVAPLGHVRMGSGPGALPQQGRASLCVCQLVLVQESVSESVRAPPSCLVRVSCSQPPAEGTGAPDAALIQASFRGAAPHEHRRPLPRPCEQSVFRPALRRIIFPPATSTPGRGGRKRSNHVCSW